jgi:hypothetical protein
VRYRFLRTRSAEELKIKAEELLRCGWLLHGYPFQLYIDGANWFLQPLMMNPLGAHSQ